MANKIFQKLVFATAGTALSLAVIEASPAHAATITYDFDVNITGGSLAGNSYNGSFSYDDSAPSPAGLQPYFTVTDFNFGFAGRTYTRSDLRLDGRRLETAYPLNITGGEAVFSTPTGAALTPRGGTLQSIQFGNVSFMGFLNSTEQPLFQLSASPTNSSFSYQLPGERATFGSGSVRYSSRTTPVPEPEDSVYALVILGLGWLLRKKIASPKRASN